MESVDLVVISVVWGSVGRANDFMERIADGSIMCFDCWIPLELIGLRAGRFSDLPRHSLRLDTSLFLLLPASSSRW